jgi:hypothetical protein
LAAISSASPAPQSYLPGQKIAEFANTDDPALLFEETEATVQTTV